MWILIDLRRKPTCASKSLSSLLFLLVAAWTIIGPALAQADVGLLPTPTLQGVQIQAQASYDPASQRYTFGYTISNPSTNTGEIWDVNLDMTQSSAGFPFLDTSGLSIPRGGNFLPFDDELATLQPLATSAGTKVTPFGQRVPAGWNGGLGVDGFASFTTRTGTPRITPGSSLGGFEVISPGLPSIRKVQIVPFWVFLVDNFENVTPEQEAAARGVEQSIIFHTFTLGPFAVAPGTFGHWDQLRADLNQAIQLGWIPDQTLANTLVTQLASARQALDAGDGTLTKSRLQALIQSANQSTPAQRRVEVVNLVVLNAQRLIENTPDTPIPFEPKVTPSPQKSSLPIGTPYTLTATVVNLGDPNHAPIPGFDVGFLVEEGTNQGLEFSGVTDTQGQLRFNYTSTQEGTDKVLIGIFGEVFQEFGAAEVTWTGGPDLVVPLFVPPLLESQGGNQFFLTEWTANIGSIASAPSTTRYFLSPNAVVDPASARVLGERTVPALGPGQRSEGGTVTLTLPSDLSAGMYHLAACADAPGTVVELEEQNNCSFSQINSVSTAVPLRFAGIPNSPPVCSAAVPSVALLWPPNHKLATITIQGVVDPDNDPVNILVTGITQDEPVNGLGDGDTSPDGFVGVGTAQAQVRKERSGAGNGRVYAISFTAQDNKGSTCSGSVKVGVPHDQGQGSVPIDDGQRYDSTQP